VAEEAEVDGRLMQGVQYPRRDKRKQKLIRK
jgi:hypothetical protein